ncbi:Aminopeptidase N precursor, partial [Reticulomyxa filosa]
ALFRPSKPMSTYLVAFVVGEYNVLTATTLGLSGSVPTSVVYPLTYEQTDAEWALRNAYKILPYYEGLFDVPYPLPKMDHAAIFDFAAGAMENWGLITYRSTDLMANEDDESEASLKNVVVVVAHELAHQWFGDIVTMEWWNDLWLNEGFASFVENLGVDYVQPQYQIWNDYVMMVSSALDLDVSRYTHPIQQP